MDKQATIILISGPLGVGKSSLSKMLKNKLKYTLVDGDSFFAPLEKNKKLSWDKRLRLSWNWIANETKKHLKKGNNVVVDFVVETELSWFIKKMSNLNAQIKYVVLVADKNEIVKRLKKRDGNIQYLERSMTLLKQLQNNIQNQEFILDTTGKSLDEVLNEVVNDKRFVIT